MGGKDVRGDSLAKISATAAPMKPKNGADAGHRSLGMITLRARGGAKGRVRAGVG